MKFEQTALVEAPRDAVWETLMVMSEVARCVPGLVDFEDLGDGRYGGTLRVSVGPISLAMKGIVRYLSKDEAAARAVLSAAATDARAAGSVKAETTIQLTAEHPSATRLDVRTEATILGRLGEFGQPIIRRKAEQLINEFARNLTQAVAAR